MAYTRDDSLESRAQEFDQHWSCNTTIVEPSYRSLEIQLDEQARELQTCEDYIENLEEENQQIRRFYAQKLLDQIKENHKLVERIETMKKENLNHTEFIVDRALGFKADLQTKVNENQILQDKNEELTKQLIYVRDQNEKMTKQLKCTEENQVKTEKLAEKFLAESKIKNDEIRNLKEIIATKDAEHHANVTTLCNQMKENRQESSSPSSLPEILRGENLPGTIAFCNNLADIFRCIFMIES